MSVFVHLRLHTEYSLLDGLVRIKPLVKQAHALGMPACAMTDQCNLFGLVKFYRAAQGAGVKPIIGVDLWIKDAQGEVNCLVLLCQNDLGYRNLTRLVSRAYQQGQHLGRAYVKEEWLTPDTVDGLIALSGGREGDIGQALLKGKTGLAQARLAAWQALFPQRFYLELQRTGRPQEEDYIHAAVDLAAAQQVPVVATNDVMFIKEEDFDAHEVRVCIHDGYTLDDNSRPRRYSEQQYLRSPEEMTELFSDIPEAIENTWHIAQRCSLELTLGKSFLPQFPIPEGMTTAEYFISESRKGLEKRLEFLFGVEKEQKRQEYDERLQIELDVIVKMDFPGYFLIVADFIRWAKENAIPVGPGRGSGAGSLVAYALDITDLDPLAYDLLFERFLNPERVSMPDFDIDFCMEGRDRVIAYVADYYGREKVSQIITYGSMAAKAVVRDVGRVLGHSYGFVDQIAKLIPFDLGITLTKALEEEESLKQRYDDDEEVHDLLDMALKLEGLTRNVGKHAGGVVIAPSELTDFSPLYCEEDGTNLVTQFDKGDVEDVGLVKFDFLGLRTLTIIDWALQTVNAKLPEDKQVDIARIPLDEAETFKLLKSGQTTAVFQLESRGMQELIKRLKPDCFEDIIALVALFRPGPLQSGMVDDFINRKHGKAKVEYPHPDLEPILKPTYGVILYQEQVMQIAQVLAGYTLGGADLLRRAMGKKKPEEMAKQRDIFMEGSVARGVEADTATYIFDLMEKFAGYGFNKSHSAAYALVSYQTAWLKVHHPAAFMAAVMSSDMDNTDKVVNFIDECRNMKLDILPPDVNVSAYKFTVSPTKKRAIHYGLGAIKGAGEAALEIIVKERSANGPYTDLFDFCQRIDLRKCNRRVLEALIKAGGLDSIGPDRAILLASLDTALKMAEQHAKDQAVGQADLFGLLAPAPTASKDDALPYAQVRPWSEPQRLVGEKETLGLYLTGHPISSSLPELKHYCKRISQIRPTGRGNTVRVAGLIYEIRTINGKRGRMAALTLDDQSARLDAMLFSDVYETYKEQIAKDKIVVVEGEVSEDKFSGGFSMSVQKLMDLPTARATYAKALRLKLSAEQCDAALLPRLRDALVPYVEPESCKILVDYHNAQASACLKFGQDWLVTPKDELLHSLQEILGENSVKLEY